MSIFKIKVRKCNLF